MKVYVDGNDMVAAFRAAAPEVIAEGDLPKTRLNVARWLARFAERQDCDMDLIFDETAVGEVLPPTEHHGRVRVVNLEPGKQAMHEIAGPANRAAGADRVQVVTDDPRLATALQRGGARVVAPQDFLSRARTMMRGGDKQNFDEPDEKFSGTSDTEVESWMEFFDEE
jgi:predicted RNA-binding protein with PIN domain